MVKPISCRAVELSSERPERLGVSRRRLTAGMFLVLMLAFTPVVHATPLTFWRALLLVFAARSVGSATARGLGQGMARGLAPSIKAVTKTFARVAGPGTVMSGSMVAAQAARPGLISRLMPVGLGLWLAWDLWKAAPALMAMLTGKPDEGPAELALGPEERLVRAETWISNETDQPIAAVIEFAILSEELVRSQGSERAGEVGRVTLGSIHVPARSRKSLSAELDLSGLKGRFVAAPVAVYVGSDRAVEGVSFEPPGLLLELI
jgi:hypothetical protein